MALLERLRTAVRETTPVPVLEDCPEQAIAIHPDAEKADRIYYFQARLARNQDTKRCEALILSPNSSLAAMNKAIATLPGNWYVTEYRVSE